MVKNWRVKKLKAKHEYYAIVGGQGGNCPIADCCITLGDRQNAHLIAAAPDMLEACEEARNWFTDEKIGSYDYMEGSAIYGHIREQVYKLQQAINKAKEA